MNNSVCKKHQKVLLELGYNLLRYSQFKSYFRNIFNLKTNLSKEKSDNQKAPLSVKMDLHHISNM